MRIMLACSAGMSTSLVVSKMRQASEAAGRDDKIWAVDVLAVDDEVGNFDVLLLGPQVRYLLPKMKEVVGDSTPVDIINPVAYGMCDGAAVLKQAEALVG